MTAIINRIEDKCQSVDVNYTIGEWITVSRALREFKETCDERDKPIIERMLETPSSMRMITR